jgi:hypothetical protein
MSNNSVVERKPQTSGDAAKFVKSYHHFFPLNLGTFLSRPNKFSFVLKSFFDNVQIVIV